MGRHNNFDLLRLIAAVQVATSHTLAHFFDMHSAMLEAIPGVPVFFVISGYLVSKSYERSSLSSYAVNRALRIFPGLWVCLAVSIAIASMWGVSFAHAGSWIVGQATFVQFYNPPFLRDFGVGVLNGCLWTIPVELQFYLAVPLIYFAIKTTRGLILAILVCAVVNCLYANWGESFAQKLVGVTLPIYLYMFLMGVLLQKNMGFIDRYLKGRLPLWIGVYLIVALGGHIAGLRAGGNFVNPVQAMALAMLVISAAHAKPVTLKYDLSYGIYLYHMPVVNLLLESGHRNAFEVAWLTTALALASWLLVERPALGLKHVSSGYLRWART